ncbi:MAG: hypothetical protein IPI21_09180 [Propionivibrio sp.]|nr:hypothetical protein [Propionivibrio sp.]
MRKDGTLGEQSFGTRLFSESEIPAWLAPPAPPHHPAGAAAWVAFGIVAFIVLGYALALWLGGRQ